MAEHFHRCPELIATNEKNQEQGIKIAINAMHPTESKNDGCGWINITSVKGAYIALPAYFCFLCGEFLLKTDDELQPDQSYDNPPTTYPLDD